MIQSYGLQLRIGCGEWDPLLANLKTLLAQAETLMLTETAEYSRAQQYYDDNTGFFDAPAVLYGSQCAAQVDMLNGIISALGKLISDSGVAPAAPTDPAKVPDADEPATLVKWVVGGAIAISAAVLAAQVLPFFRKSRK